MNFKLKEVENCVIFELEGKVIGGPKAERFRKKLYQFVDKGKKNIIADLENVSFMNSAGLGVLISGMVTMRNNGGEIKICRADKRIASLLMITRLDTVFDHHLTVESAVEAFQK